MGLVTPTKLLAAHRSEQDPEVFLIWRQSNFREQMKRSVLLVRAAVKTEVFEAGSTLLIIGAGVSGLAAGLEASKHGILVTLLESEKTLLSVQQNCPTRYLHPYEYYWPLEHYKQASFPFLKKDKLICPRQMHWKAGIASEVAKKIAFQSLKDKPNNLEIKLGMRRIPISLKSLREEFDPDGDFEYIIICSGAEEFYNLDQINVTAEKFASFKYWNKDPLEKLSTLSGTQKATRVLISGGGDGGMQDFLRIAHRPLKSRPFSAGMFLGRISPELESCPEFSEWLKIRKRDFRSFRPDPVTMWNDLSNLLDKMIKNEKCWKSISRAVQKIIDPTVTSGKRSVELIFRDSTFSEAFALNAFLVHLVTRVMHQQLRLRTNSEIERIKSAAKRHRCYNRAKWCCGKPHKVFFKTNGGATIPWQIFDLVVLRHGQKPLVPPRA